MEDAVQPLDVHAEHQRGDGDQQRLVPLEERLEPAVPRVRPLGRKVRDPGRLRVRAAHLRRRAERVRVDVEAHRSGGGRRGAAEAERRRQGRGYPSNRFVELVEAFF